MSNILGAAQLHDTQLLDDKVQFCVFIMNCRLLGLNPFTQYMHMLFSWLAPPTGVDDDVSETDSEGLEAERSTTEDEPDAAVPALWELYKDMESVRKVVRERSLDGGGVRGVRRGDL